MLLSHHGNNLHDRSFSIWPSTCSGTATGDLAQGYLDPIEFGRARPYQPTRLHEDAARNSVCLLTPWDMSVSRFHGLDSNGESHGG